MAAPAASRPEPLASGLLQAEGKNQRGPTDNSQISDPRPPSLLRPLLYVSDDAATTHSRRSPPSYAQQPATAVPPIHRRRLLLSSAGGRGCCLVVGARSSAEV